MRLPPRIKIGLGLTLVFVAGGVLGGWAHAKFTERVFLKFIDCQSWSPAIVEGLDHELKLTSEQKQRAQTMVDESANEVRQGFAKMGEELVRLHTRIQTILTPEQQAKNGHAFEIFRRELEEKYHIPLPMESKLEPTAPSREKDRKFSSQQGH